MRDFRIRDSPRTESDLREYLADTAARHGVERPDEVLRATITSVTKGALCRPFKPLRPYSGILSDHGVKLPIAAAWLREVHNQAAATTAHRGHPLDLDFLTAAFDPAEWDPYFDPVAHLLVSLLGDLLHADTHPVDFRRRGLFSAAVADGPILRDDRSRV